jgi:Lrp/AsnC family leucine-responsive transcriptional regulator
MIDAIDREILKILQQNARVSNAEIARQVRMAPSAVLERIRKLEARGVIKGYEARIDPEALGLNLLAYIFVRTNDFGDALHTSDVLARLDEVQEVHHIAGEDCFLVKARTRDARSLGRLLRDRFAAGGGIISTRTTIVLETLHESASLPIAGIPVETVEPEQAVEPAAGSPSLAAGAAAEVEVQQLAGLALAGTEDADER